MRRKNKRSILSRWKKRSNTLIFVTPLLLIVVALLIASSIYAFRSFHNVFASSTVQTIENVNLFSTSLENSDQRLLLRCSTGSCTTTGQLFSDLHFTCRKDNCTASISVSTAHNCVPENLVYGELQLDGTVTTAVQPKVFCNPSEQNGDINNLTSYTWVVSGLNRGTHTANVFMTYQATDQTGIGFDHQTLIVNTY